MEAAAAAKERMRVVFAERIQSYEPPFDPTIVYHLPDGKMKGEAEFQPVRCGGGIMFPSAAERVPSSGVCPDCLTGRITLA